MAKEKSTRGFEFSNLIEDTPENLRELLNRTIRTVREERDRAIKGTQSVSGNPYNNIAYHFNPKWYREKGASQEYYDQRVAIYQHVLKIVERVRDNFASSNMCEFTDRIRGYIEYCGRQKEELREAQKWSEFVKRNHYSNSEWFKGLLAEQRELGEAVVGLVKIVGESQQRLITAHSCRIIAKNLLAQKGI